MIKFPVKVHRIHIKWLTLMGYLFDFGNCATFSSVSSFISASIHSDSSEYSDVVGSRVMVHPKDFLQFERNGFIEPYRSNFVVPRILELDVDYAVSFDHNPVSPLRDIALDPVESR